jgi:hypothetical protein
VSVVSVEQGLRHCIFPLVCDPKIYIISIETFTIWNPAVGLCIRLKNIVICRPISRQHPKYAQATIEEVLQEVFSMLSAPCSLLGNESLNIFPQKQARRKIGEILLGNGAVKRLVNNTGCIFRGVRTKSI